ncbi:uncharacterized protein LTR77_000814 [Saxophila tyrrhenica]|uniref:Uncharacterized protein n=1 Tax=Saxophila tyrrhenica TaxID=1690608 RepID=A0AAV9PSE3_9PEZI|nr:hypothetical protein LTR77_000814 [Saxophila tyrrhenica]
MATEACSWSLPILLKKTQLVALGNVETYFDGDDVRSIDEGMNEVAVALVEVLNVMLNVRVDDEKSGTDNGMTRLEDEEGAVNETVTVSTCVWVTTTLLISVDVALMVIRSVKVVVVVVDDSAADMSDEAEAWADLSTMKEEPRLSTQML